jgi:subtilisin family serine protease
VDLFAPGQAVTSAWYTGKTDTMSKSGTSMAAPHVAGAAAMVLSANPTWGPSLVQKRVLADATNGMVGFAGSGSPNRLLYAGTGGSPPIVTNFHCESGNGVFLCDLAYHSNRTPVTVTWRVNGSVVPGWNNQLTVWSSCTTSTTVRATVTNPFGSGSSATWGGCQTGPWM